MSIKPDVETIDAYRARFHDREHWVPFVRRAAEQLGLPCDTVEETLPGSYPTFRVGEKIYKFFGELFGGVESFAVERQVYGVLAQAPDLPVPRLLGEGMLFPDDADWRWPYLVMTRVPGFSLGEGRSDLALDERLDLAREMGQLVRLFHTLPIKVSGPLRPEWGPFLNFMREQRANLAEQHAAWGLLTPTMMRDLEAYVPCAEELVDVSRAPCLLHGDLTADHWLGEWASPYRLNGVIDMGDARVGDPFYELVALHLWAFDCDKGMLRAFCQSYGLLEAEQPGFARKVMSYALLHAFDVLVGVMARSDVREMSLEELGRRLWDLDEPGLEGGTA